MLLNTLSSLFSSVVYVFRNSCRSRKLVVPRKGTQLVQNCVVLFSLSLTNSYPSLHFQAAQEAGETENKKAFEYDVRSFFDSAGIFLQSHAFNTAASLLRLSAHLIDPQKPMY